MVDLVVLLIGNIAGNDSKFGELIVLETNILKCLIKCLEFLIDSLFIIIKIISFKYNTVINIS